MLKDHQRNIFTKMINQKLSHHTFKMKVKFQKENQNLLLFIRNKVLKDLKNHLPKDQRTVQPQKKVKVKEMIGNQAKKRRVLKAQEIWSHIKTADLEVQKKIHQNKK